tara:strand:- start:2697 stop:3047 length:351 start_codon:yes stop_codon:yes gene_type:complete
MFTSLLLSLSLFFGATIDSDAIRYGNLNNFREGDAVAVIDSKKVYHSFEEYQVILKEKIKPGTARYTQLMEACTKKYKYRVKKHAVGKYVLVVEVGGVKNYKTTNITNTIIEAEAL